MCCLLAKGNLALLQRAKCKELAKWPFLQLDGHYPNTRRTAVDPTFRRLVFQKSLRSQCGPFEVAVAEGGCSVIRSATIPVGSMPLSVLITGGS